MIGDDFFKEFSRGDAEVAENEVLGVLVAILSNCVNLFFRSYFQE